MPGTAPDFCQLHAPKFCVNLTPKDICIIIGCQTRARYGLPGSVPKFCKKHVISGCINLKPSGGAPGGNFRIQVLSEVENKPLPGCFVKPDF